jgi:hypothetical protein
MNYPNKIYIDESDLADGVPEVQTEGDIKYVRFDICESLRQRLAESDKLASIYLEHIETYKQQAIALNERLEAAEKDAARYGRARDNFVGWDFVEKLALIRIPLLGGSITLDSEGLDEAIDKLP